VSAQASGRALLGVIRSVKERGGADALAKVLAAAEPATREVLEKKIRASEWYPYESFVGLLKVADRTLGAGDRKLCRELGAMGGKRDIGTAFRVFAAVASPERLIRGCRLVWSAYYRNAGTMEALAWTPERTVLRISDFPEMHPTHCRLMEGWMISTMEAIGCHVHPGGRETECASRGGTHHEFSCTWSRKADVAAK
jgi:hypothetical protein